MSRLTIDMTDQQRQRLAAMAALQGKTIGEYAIDRLFPAAGDEDAAWQELRNLLGRRVADAQRGGISSRSVAAIVDEELDAGDRA